MTADQSSPSVTADPAREQDCPHPASALATRMLDKDGSSEQRPRCVRCGVWLFTFDEQTAALAREQQLRKAIREFLDQEDTHFERVGVVQAPEGPVTLCAACLDYWPCSVERLRCAALSRPAPEQP